MATPEIRAKTSSSFGWALAILLSFACNSGGSSHGDGATGAGQGDAAADVAGGASGANDGGVVGAALDASAGGAAGNSGRADAAVGSAGADAVGGADSGPRDSGIADTATERGSLVADAAAGSSATSCRAANECTVSSFTWPVTTVADCYCVPCPSVALNLATADLYRTQYQNLCTEWRKTALCPAIACPAIVLPVACQAGVCARGDLVAPTCMTLGSGCANNAVKCGGACCQAYESCDAVTNTCRCGTTAGCTGGASCGGNGAIVCGSFCCGVGTNRPCPR